jgi:hypothetical protein
LVKGSWQWTAVNSVYSHSTLEARVGNERARREAGWQQRVREIAEGTGYVVREPSVDGLEAPTVKRVNEMGLCFENCRA